MKPLFAMLLPLLFMMPAHADDVSRDALQGRWLISAIDDEAETVKNHWEFSGESFRQIEEGKKKSEEPFTASGSAIDLGYMKIKVVAFDGKTLKARFAGFTYTLNKQ